MINKGVDKPLTSKQLLNDIRNLTSIHFDMVTISIGINDCNNAIVPLLEFRSNIQGIIDHIQRNSPNSEIVLCTPYPTLTKAINDNVVAYSGAMIDLASLNKIQYVNLSSVWPILDSVNYVTETNLLNEVGQFKIFEAMWKVIRNQDWLKDINPEATTESYEEYNSTATSMEAMSMWSGGMH